MERAYTAGDRSGRIDRSRGSGGRAVSRAGQAAQQLAQVGMYPADLVFHVGDLIEKKLNLVLQVISGPLSAYVTHSTFFP